MPDSVLDELAATVEEIRAAGEELGIRLSEPFEVFREGLGHVLYRIGYRPQGEA
jgi:hypothetical protein